MGSNPRPQLLSWLKTYSCSVRVKVCEHFVCKHFHPNWFPSCFPVLWQAYAKCPYGWATWPRHHGYFCLFYIHYMYIINVYSRRSGADNPHWTKFWCQQLTSCHFAHLLQVSKKSLWSLLYTFFNDLIHVYSPGAWADNTWRRNFYVNRNIMSLRSFVTGFKQLSLKSHYI